MKQEQWVEIMLTSINDQVTRASKSSRRMSTFFERKGEKEKAKLLDSISRGLEKTLGDIVKVVGG